MKSEAVVSRTNRNISDYVLESRLVVALSVWISRILGEKVNACQALHLLHAQVSFAALIMMSGISVLVCALLLAWFVLSVWHCAQQF